jgi:hypothetical protein
MPLLAGIVAALVAAAAPASGDAGARARRILDGHAYQTQLPAPRSLEPFTLPLGPLAILLRILLYTAVAVLVVLAVTWLARRLGRSTRDVEVSEPVAPEAVAIPIASAEALAADGRYADAIHALLLDTLAALSRAARLPASLTSREIVARVPLAPGARDALAGLVTAVEVSWFGGVTPSRADYLTCLARFHAFLDTHRRAA